MPLHPMHNSNNKNIKVMIKIHMDVHDKSGNRNNGCNSHDSRNNTNNHSTNIEIRASKH